MAGRRLCSDAEARRRGFEGTASTQRRRVLRETLAAFKRCDPPDRYHRLAAGNLLHWRPERTGSIAEPKVQVIRGDWGSVTHALTKRHRVCFAALNMANAYVPGGAYVEGASAQEEDMFRRTDSHFAVGFQELDAEQEQYRPEMTLLLSAHEGGVYLDTHRPRSAYGVRRTDRGQILGMSGSRTTRFFHFTSYAPRRRISETVALLISTMRGDGSRPNSIRSVPMGYDMRYSAHSAAAHFGIPRILWRGYCGTDLQRGDWAARARFLPRSVRDSRTGLRA